MSKSPRNLYSEADLANTSNYLRIERSLQYFADLGLRYPMKAIRGYINSGLLVGRIKNTSPKRSKKGNRYEVFIPDIPRFKRDMYQ